MASGSLLLEVLELIFQLVLHHVHHKVPARRNIQQRHWKQRQNLKELQQYQNKLEHVGNPPNFSLLVSDSLHPGHVLGDKVDLPLEILLGPGSLLLYVVTGSNVNDNLQLVDQLTLN